MLVTVALLCVACTPTPDNLKKKLENKGYTVNTYEADGIAKEEGVAQVLYAYKETQSENEDQPDVVIIVYWYDSESDAKSAYEEYKKDYTKDEEFNVKRKGKVLAFGEKELLKLV